MADKVTSEYGIDIGPALEDLKNLKAQISDYQSSVEKAGKATGESFKKSLENTQKFNDSLRKGSDAASKLSDATKLHSASINSLIDREKALTEARNRSNNTVAIERFNSKIRETKDLIDKLRSAGPGQSVGVIEGLIKKEAELTEARKKSASIKEIGQYNQKIAEVRAEMDLLNKTGTSTGGILGTISNGFKNIMASLGTFFALEAVIGFLTGASARSKDFEVALSDLSAISGVVGEDLDKMEASAEALGEKLKMNAADIVEAFKMVGSAQPELLKNQDALDAVTESAITLSKASKITLSDSVTALTGVMAQFNLGASESTRVINALAAGSVVGAAEVKDINESIKAFGVVAASSNVSVEESVALVELLAEKQIKGAEAGTALRNALLKMSSVKTLPKDALADMEKFGVDINKVSDSTLPFNERLLEFSKIAGDATALTRVFGTENQVAGQIILENVGKFDTMNKKIAEQVKIGTVAADQAKIQSENMQGAINELLAVSDGYIRAIGTGINAALILVIRSGTFFLSMMKELPKFIDDNKVAIGLLATGVISFNAHLIASSAAMLANTVATRAKILWDTTATTATTLYTAAQNALNVAMRANPIGLVITAISILAGLFVTLYNNSETLRGGLAGLFEWFKVVGKGAADFFIALSPSNLAKAIKSGDFSQIKNAFNNFGKGAGEAFTKGYNDKIKSEKIVAIPGQAKPKTPQDSGKEELNAIKNKEEKKIALIQFYKDKITELEKKRESSTSEKDIAGINKDIARNQEILDKLLGKSQKKSNDEIIKRRKELADELKKLEQQSQSAKMAMLQSDSREYIEAVYAAGEKEIAQIRKNIEEKGKLTDKNFQLSAAQEEQLEILRTANFQKRLDSLQELNRKEAEAAQKRMEDRRKEQAAYLDMEQELEEQRIKGRTRQQGDPRSKKERQEAIDFEKKKQQDLLAVQIYFAQERINMLKDQVGIEADIERQKLSNLISDLNGEMDKLGKVDKSKKFDLQSLLGVTDDEMSNIEKNFGMVKDIMTGFVAQEVELQQQRIDSLNDYIGEKQSELATEIELNKLGFASNVEGKREEIAALKQEREKAIADHRKAVKLQNAIDSAQQISQIITAVAGIIAGWSTVPFVGSVLGIAAAGAMLTAFVATKAKAKAAAPPITFREGGGFRLSGPSHAGGGMSLYDNSSGQQVAEYEGNEFLFAVNKSSTKKHLPFLEALNDNDFTKIPASNETLQQLMRETPILPSPRATGRITKLADYREGNDGKTSRRLSAMEQHLSAIVKNTGNIPDEQFIPTADGHWEVRKNRRRFISNKKS